MTFPSKVHGSKGSTRYQPSSTRRQPSSALAPAISPANIQAKWGTFIKNIAEEDKKINQENQANLQARVEATKSATLLQKPGENDVYVPVNSNGSERTKVKKTVVKSSEIPVMDEKSVTADEMTSAAKTDLSKNEVRVTSPSVAESTTIHKGNDLSVHVTSTVMVTEPTCEPVTTAASSDYLFAQEDLFAHITSKVMVTFPSSTEPTREPVTTVASSDHLFIYEGSIIVKLPFTPETVLATKVSTSELNAPGLAIPQQSEVTQAETEMVTVVKEDDTESMRKKAAVDIKELVKNKVPEDLLELFKKAAADLKANAEKNKEKEKEKENRLKEAAKLKELAKKKEENTEEDTTWVSATDLEARVEYKKVDDSVWDSVMPADNYDYDNLWIDVNQKCAKGKESTPNKTSEETSSKNTGASALPGLSRGSTAESESEPDTAAVPKSSKWSTSYFKLAAKSDEDQAPKLTTLQNASAQVTVTVGTTTMVDKWGKPLSKAIVREGEAIGGSAAVIGAECKGRTLMAKMGWTPGTGLGIMGTGMLEPVVEVFRSEKTGLGSGQDAFAEMPEADRAWLIEATSVPTNSSWKPESLPGREDMSAQEYRNLTDIPSKEYRAGRKKEVDQYFKEQRAARKKEKMMKKKQEAEEAGETWVGRKRGRKHINKPKETEDNESCNSPDLL